jgi:hypothetical protein
LKQDIVLAFEIEVNGAVCHTGRFGDLGHRGLVESLTGKNHDGGVQYLPVFIGVTFHGAISAPPGGIENNK